MDSEDDVGTAVLQKIEQAGNRLANNEKNHRSIEEAWMESSLEVLNEIHDVLVKIEARMAASDARWVEQEKRANEQIRQSTERISESMGCMSKLPKDLKQAYEEIFAPDTPMGDMLKMAKRVEEDMDRDKQNFKPIRRERIKIEVDDEDDKLAS